MNLEDSFIDDEFLSDEELANQPDTVGENGVTLCGRMWEMCTVPGMWIYVEGRCTDCEGYSAECKQYKPMILE